MAGGRKPAISKAMRSKNQRSKPQSQRAGLSRKEREYIEEYGFSNPDSIPDEAGDILNTKSKRVFNERDLDSEEHNRLKKAKLHQFEVSSNGNGDEWKTNTSYKRLVGTLRKKNRFKELIAKNSSARIDVDTSSAAGVMQQVNDIAANDDSETSTITSDTEIIDEIEPELDDDNSNAVSEFPDPFHMRFSESEDNLVKLRSAIAHISTSPSPWKVSPVGSSLSLPHTKISSYVLASTAGTESSIQCRISKDDITDMHVKHRIVEAWRKRSVKLKKIETGRETTLEGLPKVLFEVMMQYQDLIFTNRCWTNSLSIQETYCLHALNHVFKTRSQILKHNAKFSSNEGDDMIEIRDQGFTRPKVLLLLPFRNTAFDVINTILSLSSVDQVENKKRFSDEFGPPTDDTMTVDKPEDFKQTFRGNIDDCFKIGVKFTRKSAKLYSDFYSSDIIIASPIGLRMIVGSEGDKNRDYDFLSSIEVLVIDQANHLLMQNWDHLTHILDHVNLIPTKDHDCDFSRIKGYYVDGFAKYVRQTLVFSEFSFPELVSLSKKYCLNAAGRIRIKSEEFEGTIVNVIPRVKQVFQRTPVDDLESMQDVRFQWFVQKTLPLLKSATSTQPHTLIFIPEYFDYIRVRNYLDENDWNFEAICEYSDSSEIARSRTLFFQNRTPILLYTERAHFFRRFKIRGIKNLVFYSLPTHADFYSEIVNFLTLPGPDGEITSELEMNVNVTFCKFDMMKLERVVGSKRCKKMMADPRGQFLFA